MGGWALTTKVKVEEGRRGLAGPAQAGKCGPSPRKASRLPSQARAWSYSRAQVKASPEPPASDQPLCAPAPGGAPAPGSTHPIRIESSSSHVAEGQTLDLNCVVAGQAHAQVTWYKRGGSLPARHQVHGGRKVGGGQLAELWTVGGDGSSRQPLS